MTDPRYPGLPAASPRPTVVTVSSYLLYASAALSIIGGIMALMTLGPMRRAYANEYDGTANEGLESIIVGVSVVTVAINVLFAAGLAILAIYNNRAKQPARIITWVLGGFYLCCGGFGLLGTAATSGMNLDSTGGGPSAEEINEALEAELGSGFTAISTMLTVFTLLALLGAVILLALPAANAYFRRPQLAWDPNLPYPSYPGQQPPYPAQQPPYPGQQPYSGQQPPYSGQPTYPAYPTQPQSGPGGYPAYPAAPFPQAEPSTPPPGSVPPATGPAPAGPPVTGPQDVHPHTGSLPATDPWGPPPASPPSPPPASTQPPPSADDKPGRAPTDPA